MTLHVSRNVRGGMVHEAPEGFTQEEWHQSATGDTGTSHTRVGRVYLVQCEWCDESFAGATAADAMEMFRAHEDAMLNPKPKVSVEDLNRAFGSQTGDFPRFTAEAEGDDYLFGHRPQKEDPRG